MSRVLELSTRDLCTATKLSLSDATELVRYISVHYLKGSQPFVKAVDILAENSKEGLFIYLRPDSCTIHSKTITMHTAILRFVS